MNITNELERLVLIFTLEETTPDSYISENLEFKRAGSQREPGNGIGTVVSIIYAVAQRIISFTGEDGTLLTGLPQGHEYTTRQILAGKIYATLSKKQLSIQSLGINYQTTIVQTALATLKQSSITPDLNLFTQLIQRSLPSENKLDLDKNILYAIPKYLEFAKLQIELLHALHPIFYQLSIEQLTICRLATSSIFAAPEIVYENIDYNKNLSPWHPIGKFEWRKPGYVDLGQKKRLSETMEKMDEIGRKIFLDRNNPYQSKFHTSAPQAIEHYIAVMAQKKEIPEKGILNDEKDMDSFSEILEAYSFGLEAWLRRGKITHKTFENIDRIVTLCQTLLKDAPFANALFQKEQLLATAHILKIIFTPYIDDARRDKKRITSKDLYDLIYNSALFTNPINGEDSDIYIPEAFISPMEESDYKQNYAITRNFSLQLRRLFICYFSSDKLLAQVENFFSPAIKELYAAAYQHQETYHPETIQQYLSPELFNTQAAEVTALLSSMDASILNDLKKDIDISPLLEKAAKEKKKKQNKQPVRQKNSLGNAAQEVEEPVLEKPVLEEPVAEEAPVQTLSEKIQQITLQAPARLQPITYHKRVLRWQAQGEKVLRTDPAYENLPEDEYPFKIFQHSFPKEIDSYLETMFTVFSWRTLQGECILYTAPAQYTFQGITYDGVLEYAFSIKPGVEASLPLSQKKGLCFHRYLAQRKEDSICHKLAHKKHITITEPKIDQNQTGEWFTVGSTVTTEETIDSIIFKDTKNNSLISLKKPVFK